MNRTPVRLASLFALALAFSACAPGIHIKRYKPARYNLGATRSVALLNVAGPAESTGVVTAELAEHVVRGQYYRLHSQQPHTIAIVVAPGSNVVQNIEAVRAAVDAEVYVGASVTRWDYAEYEQERSLHTEDGKDAVVRVRVPQGQVSVAFQVVKAATGQVIVMREYHATVDAEPYSIEKSTRIPSQAAVLRSACARAVDDFLDDITPTTVTDKIVLDDDDEALEDGIELCKKGVLDEAMASFDRALKRNPKSSGAVYNMAVLHEARGDYEKAETFYTRALKMERKDLYLEALQNMRRRIADEQRLKTAL